MTRKEALQQALFVLTSQGTSEDLACKLKEMLDEYPSPHWSQLKIIDAFAQWIKDHGHVPTTSVIDASRDLPSHPSIENAFGMTTIEFLDKYFPRVERRISLGSYGANTASEWVSLFKNDYLKIAPYSGIDYNNRRSPHLPRYSSLSKLLGLSSWQELIANLHLPQFNKKRKEKATSGVPLVVTWTSPQKREYLRLKSIRDEFVEKYPDIYDREVLSSK